MTTAVDDRRTREVRRVTWGGAVVNVCLGTLKMLIGWTASSQALVADGIHSLSDLVTDGAVLVGSRYWSAPPDDEHPYGHGRIETIVSIAIGCALAAVGLGIAWRAVVTFPAADGVPPAWPAPLVVALVSIVTKEALYRWTAAAGLRLRCRALVANAWHHRSDALSSVPVAVAVLGSHLFPRFTYLDHIAAVLVSAMILKAAWKIAWPCLREITEAQGYRGADELLQRCRPAFPRIREIHKVRSRRVGGSLLIDLHMLVDPDMPVAEAHETAEAFKHNVMDRNNSIADVLVHIEPFSEIESQHPER